PSQPKTSTASQITTCKPRSGPSFFCKSRIRTWSRRDSLRRSGSACAPTTASRHRPDRYRIGLRIHRTGLPVSVQPVREYRAVTAYLQKRIQDPDILECGQNLYTFLFPDCAKTHRAKEAEVQEPWMES